MEQFSREYVANPVPQDMRNQGLTPPTLILTELNPLNIIEGQLTEEGLLATEEITTCGAMRETCPFCEDEHLQLVLRQKAVKVAHLFCKKCTRCFHASYQDGSPALALV